MQTFNNSCIQSTSCNGTSTKYCYMRQLLRTFSLLSDGESQDDSQEYAECDYAEYDPYDHKVTRAAADLAVNLIGLRRQRRPVLGVPHGQMGGGAVF